MSWWAARRPTEYNNLMHEAFLAAVWDDPEDEATRLVFADWLEGRDVPFAWKLRHPGRWELGPEGAHGERRTLYWVPAPDPDFETPCPCVGTLPFRVLCGLCDGSAGGNCFQFAQVRFEGLWVCWGCLSRVAPAPPPLTHELSA